MKSSVLASLIVIAASTATAQFTNQSAPFDLILLSSNHTLNGSYLGACHEGAAIEGLCVVPPPAPGISSFANYQFNTSNDSPPFDPKLGQEGILTFSLPAGNFNESEGLILNFNPTSNVAVPEFFPGDEQSIVVAFDDKDRLNIQSYEDDTTNPPTSGKIKAYYRWYVCTTKLNYQYFTLAWVFGSHSPENPSCEKVEVVRVFI